MKLMVIFGTRPEVIKLAPVVFEAQKHSAIELLLCSSGQHRQMLDQALKVFELKPHVELSCMQDGQTLAGLTSKLIERITDALLTYRPDVVMVQGDTTTAFTSALAAFYLHIPVAHVEAGLRTGIFDSPFPEEFYRVAISRIAKWHFAPTQNSADCLHAEAINRANVFICGNTVVDAIDWIKRRWSDNVQQSKFTIHFENSRFVLITSHRRENLGKGLQQICNALKTLCRLHPKVGFVFPVHLNPEVRKVVFGALNEISNLRLIEPVCFEESLHLQSRCSLIITDSGGIQEEAPTFGVPIVVLRDNTERSEGVALGFAKLVGTDTNQIIDAVNYYLNNPGLRGQLLKLGNPYGDGQASRRIISGLLGESMVAFRG